MWLRILALNSVTIARINEIVFLHSMHVRIDVIVNFLNKRNTKFKQGRVKSSFRLLHLYLSLLQFYFRNMDYFIIK